MFPIHPHRGIDWYRQHILTWTRHWREYHIVPVVTQIDSLAALAGALKNRDLSLNQLKPLPESQSISADITTWILEMLAKFMCVRQLIGDVSIKKFEKEYKITWQAWVMLLEHCLHIAWQLHFAECAIDAQVAAGVTSRFRLVPVTECIS